MSLVRTFKDLANTNLFVSFDKSADDSEAGQTKILKRSRLKKKTEKLNILIFWKTSFTNYSKYC
jgi:hypothetical protein